MSVSLNKLNEHSRNLLQNNNIESPTDNNFEEFPTSSIRVLLVDADSNSMLLMKDLMTQFSYQVTNYENGEDAIAFLMERRHEIDLVIWDFDMPKINGLGALKTIGKKMNLPVVIMSRDHNQEPVMKSTTYGACDFLVKPVSKEVIAVLWRHVFRKRMSKSGLAKPYKPDTKEDDDDENLYQSNEEGSRTVEYSGEHNSSDQKGGKNKKPRMTWTPELHHKFKRAVEKIGSIEKAYPKQILKCMQEDSYVEGLTRNNVASHLQKFRQGTNKKNRGYHEIHEDFGFQKVEPNATLASSRPLLNAPIQYPSSTYQTLMNTNPFMTTNPLANYLPYMDQFHQPQQQSQQQYYSPIQLPSVINKQESGHVSPIENSGQLIFDSTLPYDPEFYPPGYTNFNQFNPY